VSITNAMTVDVEDYFQVSAFESAISRDAWDKMPCRVEKNMEKILAMFGDAGIRATFFTLGWVAERYPNLVRDIVAQGHELASHGYSHVRVTQQQPAEFRADVVKTKKMLEDISGVSVRGYRAASYSIGASNLWALDELSEAGYNYSSSIYPVHHDLYGMPEAPRFAFHPCGEDGILEIPITTIRFRGKNIPCGGGGFFRLYPYIFSRWALRRVNGVDGQPGMFYFHPWEIDPDQPKQKGISMRARFRHYLNLPRMEDRLRSLLKDFSWGRMDEIFLRNEL
jgi:polysaccharide deacetylase family protein (PEP-CTERM system associated)